MSPINRSRSNVLLSSALLALSGCGGGETGGQSGNPGVQPVALATEQQTVAGLALGNDGYLYWSNTGRRTNNFMDGAIFRVPVGGGTPELIAADQTEPGALAVDATHVYWLNYSDQVMRAPKAGGDATPLWPIGTGAGGIALDDTFVYWAAGDEVMKIAKTATETGDIPMELATGQDNASGVVLDSDNVYWVNSGTLTQGYADGTVTWAPKDGSAAPTTMFTEQHQPTSITSSPDTLYWRNAGFNDVGAVMSGPKTGGSATLLAVDESGSGEIALSGDTLYWVNFEAVLKMSAAATTPTTLAASQYRAGFIAVDDTSVYWGVQGGIDAPDSAIYKAPR